MMLPCNGFHASRFLYDAVKLVVFEEVGAYAAAYHHGTGTLTCSRISAPLSGLQHSRGST